MYCIGALQNTAHNAICCDFSSEKAHADNNHTICIYDKCMNNFLVNIYKQEQ